MNVFISQPMGNLTDEEVRRNREKAMKEAMHILGDDIVIIDSYFGDNGEDHPVALLGQSLERLAKADVAYFYDGWENARGCRIEHDVCEAYHIPCVERTMQHPYN